MWLWIIVACLGVYWVGQGLLYCLFATLAFCFGSTSEYDRQEKATLDSLARARKRLGMD